MVLIHRTSLESFGGLEVVRLGHFATQSDVGLDQMHPARLPDTSCLRLQSVRFDEVGTEQYINE